jgi:O-methyltransferase involved in polyketide biosynthesis
MSTKLSGIPETLLIPLWARAVEGDKLDPIVRDIKASEIVLEIDYDFSKFESSRLSQLGVSIRTMLLDNAVSAFLRHNPNAVVINLGAGLDTRYNRLELDKIVWYELDLPESMELRRRFFTESEWYRFISKSVFDKSWMDEIEDTGKPVLLIAEGLFMYFDEEELKPLFKKLVDRFPGGEMLLEAMGPFLVGKGKHHDSISKIDGKVEFKWGLKDSRDIAKWYPGITFVEEWCYFDYHKDRAGLVGRIVRLPFIRPRLAPRIVHLRFADPLGEKSEKGGKNL